MSQKEKILNADLYNPNDKQLIEMRKQARLLFEQYNQTSIIELEKRKEILLNLLCKFGKNFYINLVLSVTTVQILSQVVMSI